MALDPEVPATKGRSRLARAPFGLVFLGIWLACGTVGALLVFAVDYPNQRRYTQLDNHGTVVMAEVTRTEPINHNTVYYTFVHGSTRYSSSDSSDPPNLMTGGIRTSPVHAIRTLAGCRHSGGASPRRHG